MMKTTVKILMSLVLAVVAYSCIENDIPYPRIQANFTYISAVGQSQAASIDSTNRLVTLYFPEDANIYEVRIDSFALTPQAYVADCDLLTQKFDFTTTQYVTLGLYQEYQWRLQASQPIERYFSVEGQIGTSAIDVPGRRVVANISSSVSLDAVKVLSIKLGPTGSVMSPNIDGQTVDFSHIVTINVENYGHYEAWTIYLVQTDASVETVRADAWTKVAWVYGQAQADRTNGVQYRLKGDTEWIEVPQSWVTHNGGDFYARITGLTPEATYEARATSDDDLGEAVTFTMGKVEQMPNSSFDDWWLDGKVWNPWPEGGQQYWDTGNKGATTLGNSNSVPTDDTVTGTGQAAKLETKFVGIGVIGKLAAGNIFVGSYVRTDGTNGVLSMGQPFTQRPTKLVGYMKYTTAPISSTTTGYEDLKGENDTSSIWIALIDSSEAYEIRTNPSNRQLFDPEASCVVAYGHMDINYDVPAYTPFEIELEYKATNRTPTYILCAASASKLGDFFTGGNGAVLYVDDFSLEYDY